MDRNQLIQQVKDDTEIWDFIIIGGGATGLGTAVEAASRGYKTLLLEQHDFAKGTSSRSTKLVHGGVRYLRQGNIALVLEALRERGLSPTVLEGLSRLFAADEILEQATMCSFTSGPRIGRVVFDELQQTR